MKLCLSSSIERRVGKVISVFASKEFIQVFISWSGFIISVCLLFLQFRNRKTQVSSYYLSRATSRSSSIVFTLVDVEQLGDSVLIKLALFNPGSVASIIHSCSIFESSKVSNSIVRFFSGKWHRVDGFRWWPVEDSTDKSPKLLAEAYKNLYVKDVGCLFMLMPGMVDRRTYKFEIRTNNGYVVTESRIDSKAAFFSHHYEERYSRG